MSESQIAISRGARESNTDPEVKLDPEAKLAASLNRIIAEMLTLPTEDRRKLIDTVTSFFGITFPRKGSHDQVTPLMQSSLSRPTPFQFSEEEAPSAKAFLLSKSPETDVERVACIAYFLTHFRGTPHFKTRDITTINIESAHRRFSNPTLAVDNATKMGYLVPSVKGSKQLSAFGEQIVEALPDREAVKELRDRGRTRRSRRPARKINTKPEGD